MSTKNRTKAQGSVNSMCASACRVPEFLHPHMSRRRDDQSSTCASRPLLFNNTCGTYTTNTLTLLWFCIAATISILVNTKILSSECLLTVNLRHTDQIGKWSKRIAPYHWASGLTLHPCKVQLTNRQIFQLLRFNACQRKFYTSSSLNIDHTSRGGV
jgi:hypothetical protein